MDDRLLKRWFEQQQRLMAATDALVTVTDDSGFVDDERWQSGIWSRTKSVWFGENREGPTESKRDAPEGHCDDSKRF